MWQPSFARDVGGEVQPEGSILHPALLATLWKALQIRPKMSCEISSVCTSRTLLGCEAVAANTGVVKIVARRTRRVFRRNDPFSTSGSLEAAPPRSLWPRGATLSKRVDQIVMTYVQSGAARSRFWAAILLPTKTPRPTKEAVLLLQAHPSASRPLGAEQIRSVTSRLDCTHRTPLQAPATLQNFFSELTVA